VDSGSTPTKAFCQKQVNEDDNPENLKKFIDYLVFYKYNEEYLNDTQLLNTNITALKDNFTLF